MLKTAFLRQLVSTYKTGRLVPFLGAGMSRPACPDWGGFVEALEKRAGLCQVEGDLLARGHAALRTLRRRDGASLGPAIREALGTRRAIPEQTLALASLHWPLVITTNYDDLFLSAATDNSDPQPRRTSVLGRCPDHVNRVLSSLREPSESLLWALHGYVGGQSGRRNLVPEDTLRRLETELVVGHDEYRRLIHREPHFRRAFAEVFRQRSFLFLGSGLSDPHLLGLFAEVLELSGPNTTPHFAVVCKRDLKQINTAALAEQFGILTYVVAKHEDLPPLLREFADLVATAPGLSSVSYDLGPEGGHRRLELARGTPDFPPEGECVAFSAGLWNGRFFPSRAHQPVLEKCLARGLVQAEKQQPPALKDGRVTTKFADAPVYYVVARDIAEGGGQRDLRVVQPATEELLETACQDGFSGVHTQVLASGSGSTVPARFALSQMIRAFANWSSRDRRSGLERLRIFIREPDLWLDVSSGRLDIAETLSAVNCRFWVEVHESAELTTRQLELEPSTWKLAELCQRLSLTLDGWDVEVLPASRRGQGKVPLREAFARSIGELGIVPGATLRFTRSVPEKAEPRPGKRAKAS
ncbi:MAG TPA: SIR2 family protein [Myxococcaceae bacterium]|nr:SIR2 family protein [Myxococcaceae bacterium]